MPEIARTYINQLWHRILSIATSTGKSRQGTKTSNKRINEPWEIAAVKPSTNQLNRYGWYLHLKRKNDFAWSLHQALYGILMHALWHDNFHSKGLVSDQQLDRSIIWFLQIQSLHRMYMDVPWRVLVPPCACSRHTPTKCSASTMEIFSTTSSDETTRDPYRMQLVTVYRNQRYYEMFIMQTSRAIAVDHNCWWMSGPKLHESECIRNIQIHIIHQTFRTKSTESSCSTFHPPR